MALRLFETTSVMVRSDCSRVGGVLQAKLETKESIPLLSWKPYEKLFFFPEKQVDAHKQIILLLLEKEKLAFNEVWSYDSDSSKITWPLYLAAQTGKSWLCRKLLSDGKSEVHLNKANHRGKTPLWIAVFHGHLEVAHFLLQRGANVNDSVSDQGDSILDIAVRRRHDTMVDLLLNAGAAIRWNAVHVACHSGHHQILDILLQKLVEEKNLENLLSQQGSTDGFTCFLTAAEMNRVECLRHILNYFPKALTQRTETDNAILGAATALHIATLHGRYQAMCFLISVHPEGLLETTSSGDTPLHLAVKNSHLPLAKHILSIKEGKESCAVVNQHGQTPRDLNTCEALFSDSLGVLLQNMLNRCSREEWEEACQILRDYGETFGAFEYRDVLTMDLGRPIPGGFVWKSFANGIALRNLASVAKLCGVDSFWLNFFNRSLTGMEEKRLKDARSLSWQAKQLLELIPLDVGKTWPQLQTQGDIPKPVGIVTTHLQAEGEVFLMGYIQNLSKELFWIAKSRAIEAVVKGEVKHPLPVVAWTLFEDAAVRASLNCHSQPLVDALWQSFSELPLYEGKETYYHVARARELKEKDMIGWNNFLLTRTDTTLASEWIQKGPRQPGIVFIIQSKKGRLLNWGPQPYAVVFDPTATFRVMGFYKRTLTCLYQGNMRNVLFALPHYDPACFVLLQEQ